MGEKVKAVKKNPVPVSGSAEIYQTRSHARSNMINFGRSTSSGVRDGFFFKAGISRSEVACRLSCSFASH
jgi:hypothetical protein